MKLRQCVPQPFPILAGRPLVAARSLAFAHSHAYEGTR